MNIEHLAILDYVYSREKTDNEFKKQIEEAIKQRVCDGNWEVFNMDLVWQDIHNILDSIELTSQYFTMQKKANDGKGMGFRGVEKRDMKDLKSIHLDLIEQSMRLNPVPLKMQFKDGLSFSSERMGISILIGKTITNIEGLKKDSDEVYIKTSDGSVYYMFHDHECCESVWIEDVCGDVEDLIGSPVLVAEEVRSDEYEPLNKESDESYTWTFYKLATAKGYVDIRWYGTSNGYYSEGVDFKQLK